VDDPATPVTNEGDAPETGAPADFAPFKGVIRLSRFKMMRDKIDLSTEEKIIEVPVDRWDLLSRRRQHQLRPHRQPVPLHG
jgi:cytochrome c